MNPILEALQSGHSHKKILEFIKKLDPKLAGPIALALQGGHSVQKILSFLTHGGKKLSSNLPEAPKNLYTHARTSVHPAVGGMAKTALGALGATALGRYALGRALPQNAPVGELLGPEETVNQPLGLPYNRPGLPSPEQAGFEQQAPVPEGTIPMGFKSKPLGERAQEPENQIKTEIPQPVGQSPIPTPQIDSANLLEKLGVRQNVDTMIKRGNAPDAIAALVNSMITKEGKKLLKEGNIPLESVVADYAAQIPKQAEKPTAEKSLEKAPEEPQKKPLAALPSGLMGEIENVKNGIAKINVDGEIKHRKLDEVVESPIPQKDLADLFDELNAEIEKETGEPVSRNVSWAGYDPTVNELMYLPHDGGAYIYDDIPQDDVKTLTDILTLRKSTGENFIGSWQSGSKSPIGAAMSALIQKLQKERGGKGKEYTRKFQKIYDALEGAKEAKKRKFKEEQQKKREAKKRKK